ncbi:MAG: YdgA family protein [Gammaproteobacteria bacterium]|nr:YdgA family protein [Gammaproteobacteria bacterium]MDH4255063.1 YdgA family protein [Gammaproteobacteria bacterium]MDH5309557.1 YdgA family protein [Gammaproteobacteria bacterium]
MKRWVVILLIALAVVLLLSPGIVGRMAERNLSDSLSWMQQESDDIVVTSEAFQRGWFTSEGRHRIALSDAGLAEIFGGPPPADSDQPPTLIIDTHIDHGLVPFTSLGREHGTLVPGIASSVSTLSLEYETGDVVELPGRMYSSVGLTGDTTHRYLTDEGSRIIDGGTLSWQGADITVTSDSSRRVFTFDGSIEPLSLEDELNSGRLGRITFTGAQDRRVFELGVGDMRIEVDGAQGVGPALEEAGFRRLVAELSTELHGDRVSGRYRMEFDDLISDPLGSMDLELDLSVTGLHATSLQALVDALDRAQDPSATSADIEPEFAALVAYGWQFHMERFSFRLPQGDLRGTLNVEIPASGDPDQFSWPALLLAMKASMDVSIDAPLYDYMVTVQPEFATAAAMGLLSATGDTYEMKAAFESGLLTINGAPLPIPLNMQQ